MLSALSAAQQVSQTTADQMALGRFEDRHETGQVTVYEVDGHEYI